jgi:predicted PurR-regulated permease PerM
MRQGAKGFLMLHRPSPDRTTPEQPSADLPVLERAAPPKSELSFLGKVLLVVLVVALALAVWQLSLMFILGFGAIIVAVTLDNLASPVADRLRISHHLALGITTVALFLVSIAFLAAFGTRAADQFTLLAAQLPGAWNSTRDWLNSWELGRWFLTIGEDAAVAAASTILSALPLASGVVGWIANIALMIVIGIYLAADPHTYLDGAIRLFPPSRRKRAKQIINAAGDDLRKWLIAMTLDMLFLGTLVGIGLYMIGVPVAFALGILSGLSVFVPYIGPIVATIPGLLIALSVSPTVALSAAAVYVIAQQLEGNVALPLLQRWTVSMPPAVSLLAIVAFGLLFGVWGVLLATPLAVVTIRVVRMAYVEDVLEHRTPA